MKQAISELDQQQPISLQEQQRRQRAMRMARVSVGLEGFKPSPEVVAHAERYATGEIDLQELVKGKVEKYPVR